LGSSRNERTAMWLRYRSSFLATSYASLLRVIGRRFLVHPNTWILHVVVNINTRRHNWLSGHTWHELLLAGYPGNLERSQFQRTDGKWRPQSTYQQPTRDGARGIWEYWFIPAVESRKRLTECISHVYAWTTVHAERDRLQRIEIELLSSMVVDPLRYPDPVGWAGCNGI